MNKILSLLCAAILPTASFSQQVDYSVVSVPEETGTNFTRITTDNDYVCMPEIKRNQNGVDWLTNKILDITTDGEKIAFLSYRSGHTNVFIKDLARQGAAVQRTNRNLVLDFSYSPDGKYLAFSETVLKNNVIYQTDANSGFVCRQITSGNQDYSPVYSPDMSKIFFSRLEAKTSSIWSYDIKNNFLSSYANGMNPSVTDKDDVLLCIRTNGFGKGEIWRINYTTGTEECIVSDAMKSFSTPSISPDGKWILFVASSTIPAGTSYYWNTDIYVCREDGTQLSQLTYHAADDLSPVWSRDGKYIYFISQRGSAEGTANVWRMSFNLY